MKKKIIMIFCLGVFGLNILIAQNPIIRNQFSADPTARVFNGKVYLYPSHDILAPADQTHLRKNWFCMEDYHVFSSENLTEWTDHGIILTQTDVPWADPNAYSMWAPDCIEKNGKYYFYFPTISDSTFGKATKKIGVAVADKPEGPFTPEPTPIKGMDGIDPNAFIDKDGKAYVYWTMRKEIYGAELKDNMLELASEPVLLKGLPDPKKGLKEGPFLFERKGIYYMTIPHVENRTERLECYMGDNPMGPFKFSGVIMDKSPKGCWTNHQSIIEFKNQWYLFYHHNDYSPQFDKNRSVRIDSLFFNADGTIQKVIPSWRGVGLTNASEEIQIDRYTAISDKGISIVFNDSSHTFGGWKTVFSAKDAWIQYNAINFGKGKYKHIELKVNSELGSTLQLRLNSVSGPIIANINIPKGKEWQELKVSLSGLKPGIHNLFIQSMDDNSVEVDWISFK